MKEGKLRLGFAGISDKKLVELGRGIVDNMTNNPNFPDVGDYLLDAKTSYDAYIAAIPAPALRNSVNAAYKNEKKKVCIEDFKYLGRYIESIALGNKSILETTGYELVKKPARKPILGSVEDVHLRTNGIPNMVIAMCKRNNNADMYEARISTDDTDWKYFGASTSRTVQVKDLPVGVQLFIQMRMKNSHGYGPWSGSVLFQIPANNAVPALVD